MGRKLNFPPDNTEKKISFIDYGGDGYDYSDEFGMFKVKYTGNEKSFTKLSVARRFYERLKCSKAIWDVTKIPELLDAVTMIIQSGVGYDNCVEDAIYKVEYEKYWRGGQTFGMKRFKKLSEARQYYEALEMYNKAIWEIKYPECVLIHRMQRD